MYIYIYTCIYVYMYICIYVYMYIYIYIYVYMYIYIYIYINMYVCMYVCTDIYNTHTHTYAGDGNAGDRKSSGHSGPQGEAGFFFLFHFFSFSKKEKAADTLVLKAKQDFILKSALFGGFI